jgi:hypothetical protein
VHENSLHLRPVGRCICGDPTGTLTFHEGNYAPRDAESRKPHCRYRTCPKVDTPKSR